MLRLRLGFIFAAVALSGCDHHHPNNQAQAETGGTPVAQTDSALTGEPSAALASPANSTPPRALPVDLPAEVPATTAPPPTDTASENVTSSSSSDTTSSPPANPPSQASSDTSSPSDSTASAAPSSSTSSDSDMARLPITPASPVIATSPPAAPASDDSSAQEQVVVLETSLGRIVIELDDAAAPLTCKNFRKLVSTGFYDHTTFHRIIPQFMIQGGDPNSKSNDRVTHGQGGPGYTLPPEIKLKHDLGAVAMARLPDSVNPKRESNGSQFYICVAPCPSLDDQYTVFGHVIQGLDIATKIAGQPRDSHDNPTARIEMEASLVPKNKAMADDSARNSQ